MLQYYCEAMDAIGQEICGLVRAHSTEEVEHAFRRRGYFVVLIREPRQKDLKKKFLFQVSRDDMEFAQAIESRSPIRTELFEDSEAFRFARKGDETLERSDEEAELSALANPRSEASVVALPQNSADLFERSIRLSSFVRGRLEAWSEAVRLVGDNEFLATLSYTEEAVRISSEFYAATLSLVKGRWSYASTEFEIHLFTVDNHWTYVFWKAKGGEGGETTFGKRLNDTEALAFKRLCNL